MQVMNSTYVEKDDVVSEAESHQTLRAIVRPVWKRVKGRVPPPLVFALRQLLLELQIAGLHRTGVRQARRLRNGAEPLRLNLASGYIKKDGWINVDLFGPAANLRLDLRRPLPFPNGCAGYIYTEHFFEHLDYPNLTESMGWEVEGNGGTSEALQFLRECRRVLSPGGVVDVVVPDAEGMIDVYISSRNVAGQGEWWGPRWCDTAMHRVNYLFRQGRQHKYAYDEETLTRVLEQAGFVDVQRRQFDPEMDAPNHAIGSLCMTARKPRT
jgi:predicted SAM-dependent methyltransferase